MNTSTIPEELRSPIDDIRSWLCQSDHMPDGARTAARSLLALVHHDLDRIDGVVAYFVGTSMDEAVPDRLMHAARFAVDMAHMERARRQAAADAQQQLVERTARWYPAR